MSTLDEQRYQATVTGPHGARRHLVLLDDDLLANANWLGIPGHQLARTAMEILVESGLGHGLGETVDLGALVRSDGLFARQIGDRVRM